MVCIIKFSILQMLLTIYFMPFHIGDIKFFQTDLPINLTILTKVSKIHLNILKNI